MCFWPMKMLGTERCLVMSSRASWIAAPSSVRKVLAVALLLLWVRYHVLTNLVELEDVGLCAHLAQKALG
jgi:hypothetical protein